VYYVKTPIVNYVVKNHKTVFKMKNPRICLIMASLSLIFSHVCAQETPSGDARYRANIGLHYNLPLIYESGSTASGFYRKPESLVGILTPSLSLPAGQLGDFHLIEVARFGLNQSPGTIERFFTEIDSSGPIPRFIAHPEQAPYQSKVEIAVRYEYGWRMHRLSAPGSPVRYFFGLSTQVGHFEGKIGPSPNRPHSQDLRQWSVWVGVQPHLQYSIGRRWVLDAGLLLPVFNLAVDTERLHNPALTDAQRSTGGFNLDLLKGTHLRLGAHYVF